MILSLVLTSLICSSVGFGFDFDLEEGLKAKIQLALCTSCFTNSTGCILNECNCEHNRAEVGYSPGKLALPQLHCRQDRIVNIGWRLKEHCVYFLEVFKFGQDPFYTSITKCSNITLSGLEETEYTYRLWSFDSELGELSSSEYTSFKTLGKTKEPQPVEALFLSSMEYVNNSYKAQVGWKSSEDRSCFYDVVWYDSNDVGDYKQIEIREPEHLHNIKLEELQFGSNVTVFIMATMTDKESPKTWLNFQVPTCLETFSNLSTCVPETPKNFQVGETFLNIEEGHPLYNVELSWSIPTFQPDYYIATLVTIFDQENPNPSETRLNISGDSIKGSFKQIKLGLHYQVFLTGYSSAGPSPPAHQYKLVNSTKQLLVKTSWSSAHVALSIVIPLSVLVLLTMALLYCNCYKSRKAALEQRIKDLENPRVCYNASLSETAEEEDEWEILPEKIIFNSVLGEGAFGIVRRAWLESESKKVEVAIKMLKDRPSQSELREFYHEIEIMKSVGAHPNLVSMIGCCTKPSSKGPLLVVEYCSKGDLQSFLRTAWDFLSEEFQQDSQGHNFSNKIYDIEKLRIDKAEYFLQPADLISYARQVSLGMEYLSSLRVIHRDLAARNVLVCEDRRTVKISDFGLSRDIYRDNVYCKIGGGKLPIRWMALESMTHQRYTTQSDVWSFGILLWEIVTLGGNPYPGVTTQDLISLLKNGYRMERPPNCSLEIYDLMSQCWRATPKDRPTFSELRKSLDSLLEGATQYLNLDFFTSNEPSLKPTNKKISAERYVKPLSICNKA